MSGLEPGPMPCARILEALPDAVVVTDAASRILFANRAYCEMTGYALDQVLGKTPALARSAETGPETVRDIWDSLGAIGQFHGQLTNRHADGSSFRAEVRIARFDGEQGVNFVCRLRDVSAEVELERRYAQAAAAAAQARDTTILALAGLAEKRDDTTGAHLERIESYATALARWVADKHAVLLPKWARDPELIGRCAVLHDIGKVGIPDAVLLKPGKLDPEEQRIMREHPRLGAEIIDRVLEMQPDAEFLRVARDAVAYHHEAYDGSGYPYGLAGQQIPLVAQIVAVADVLDALTSKRPYKPAHGFDAAVKWIVERSGTKFQPLVVDALQACREQIEAAYHRLGDSVGSESAPIAGSGMDPIRREDRAKPPEARSSRSGPSPTAALLEAVSSATGGELIVRSGEVVGRVYVCCGRVAWAYLSSERMALQDRLREEAGLGAGVFEAVVADCKASGANFCEELVRRGHIERDRLRELMRKHIGERLRSVLALPNAMALFAPQARGYSSDLTFAVGELIAPAQQGAEHG